MTAILTVPISIVILTSVATLPTSSTVPTPSASSPTVSATDANVEDHKALSMSIMLPIVLGIGFTLAAFICFFLFRRYCPEAYRKSAKYCPTRRSWSCSWFKRRSSVQTWSSRIEINRRLRNTANGHEKRNKKYGFHSRASSNTTAVSVPQSPIAMATYPILGSREDEKLREEMLSQSRPSSPTEAHPAFRTRSRARSSAEIQQAYEDDLNSYRFGSLTAVQSPQHSSFISTPPRSPIRDLVRVQAERLKAEGYSVDRNTVRSFPRSSETLQSASTQSILATVSRETAIGREKDGDDERA